MPLLRRHRQLAAWVALVALVLATLAPGISRAMAYSSGDAWALGQVCSANAEPRDAGTGAPSREAAHLLEHCPFCALHSDAIAPPPAPASGIDAPLLAHALPALFLHAPRPLHAWAAVQARAPPLFV
jgi:hypothetical protein